jgi:hypothetical protein
LLALEPAQITFRLVVVKGNGEVIEEREHLILLEQEPFEEIACGRLWQPAALPGSTHVVRRSTVRILMLNWVSVSLGRRSATNLNDSWAAAVLKWTAPVKTIEKVKTAAGSARALAGGANKAQI